MNRRTCLASLLGLVAVPAFPATASQSASGLAITIDDFGLDDDPLHTGQERDLRIRRALDAFSIKGAGFVSGRNAVTENGPRVLKAWSDEGHLIGNHTFSHNKYTGDDLQAYWEDILKAEAVLELYPAYRKLFRFPYLNEGKTVEARDAMRRLLNNNGYRNGHVTIDTSDWLYNSRLVARLEADPKADLAPYRQAYLDHMWQKATQYDELARKVFGRPIDHTLLIHHNLINGLFLGDLLEMFEKRGWRLVDAAPTFDQPELARTYDAMPSGQSVVLQAAIATRHPDAALFPDGESAIEKAKLDALGL